MKKLFLSMTLFLVLSVGSVHAQTQTASQFCQGGSCTYVPLEPLPGLPDCYGPNPPSTCKNPGGTFASLVGSSFKLLIGAGAVVAVVMIVLGALTYMFSDIVGNKKKALDRIRGAMWGIVLLVSSYLILYTINPDLLTFNLNLGASSNFNTTPSATTNTAQSTQTVPTQDQIDTCQRSGGYYTSVNATWTCNLSSTPI